MKLFNFLISPCWRLWLLNLVLSWAMSFLKIHLLCWNLQRPSFGKIKRRGRLWERSCEFSHLTCHLLFLTILSWDIFSFSFFLFIDSSILCLNLINLWIALLLTLNQFFWLGCLLDLALTNQAVFVHSITMIVVVGCLFDGHATTSFGMNISETQFVKKSTLIFSFFNLSIFGTTELRQAINLLDWFVSWRVLRSLAFIFARRLENKWLLRLGPT